MPITSTNRGHMDEERVKIIVGRVLESLGKEKSIWEHYNEMAAVEDNIREVEWRDLADTILLFDGLYAAFLSAFLVFTIPQLQPNSIDIARDVLIHISQQLSNSTTLAYAPTVFTVSPNIVGVNLLFFLSLALVFVDAFLAMLVKSWLQEFDREWGKYTVAGLRSQERERRLQGLERWKLAKLVTLLPILIQASFLSFCVGLIVLLFPLHLISAILSSVALVAGFGFYVFTTYVSVLDVYAPFSSPVSHGLVNLMNVLRKSSIIQRIISPHTAGLGPPHEHQAGANPSQETTRSLSVDNRVAHSSSLLQGDKNVKRREAVTRYQIDPLTHVEILERLVTGTVEAMENIPVFLELLDQPVKDHTLWPSNVEKWKQLLHTTLELLGDPSTFSDSVARTIARNAVFWYDGGTAAKHLFKRLKSRFGDMGSDQKGTRMPLNSLAARYLDYNCGFYDTIRRDVFDTIASLEPSDAADAELLWVVITFTRSMAWQRFTDSSLAYRDSLHLFTAVLTYVSSTEQSRRSQVPLTAAVIHTMHTIKSAIDSEAIDSILGNHVIPGTVLTDSDSMSRTFHQVDALDLWSGPCPELASGLLEPHTHWSRTDADYVWKFQLPLVAALYIDGTRQAGHASSTFVELLKPLNIPDITMSTWVWADTYDRTKLVGYWYMALFQEPLYRDYLEASPFPDIRRVVVETIQRYRNTGLSALYLLDTSLKHLSSTAPSSSTLLLRTDNILKCTLPGSHTPYYAVGPFDPWMLLHLETLLVRRCIVRPHELVQLDWTDTPEQVHIANARLALYDRLEGEDTKQIEPEPQLLKIFLKSNDYVVCTGAFKWCLNLVTSSHPNAPGIFVLEIGGCGWIDIEHLIQVLCGDFLSHRVRSWKFLAEHLFPKWTMLPSSWRSSFASAFIFSNINPPGMPELHAYQSFTGMLRVWGTYLQSDQLRLFLPFLVNMVAPTKADLTWGQLTSIDSLLANLPEILENQDAHAQLGHLLATRKQELVEEAMAFFTELPMASGRDE